MWVGDLTREVLAVFVEAAGPRQRERLTAWESARMRRRPTRGENMVLAIAKKAEALGAVAKGLEGLSPEDAREVLVLVPTMTAAKLGALASIVRDLGSLSPDEAVEVVAWAESAIPDTEASPNEPRPPRAARAPAPSSGRPMRSDRAKRLAFVEKQGRVTMEEFRKNFDLTKTTACHWLTKAADDGLIHRESQGVYVSLAMATSTASEAGGS